jgi:hypothetical protein
MFVPMTEEEHVGIGLLDFVSDFGLPARLTVNGASVQGLMREEDVVEDDISEIEYQIY